jgi:Alginate O-acetyl transferase AlgF
MKIGKIIAVLICTVGMVLNFSFWAFAQEAGLYDAPPPEGTSYVRFLNRSKLAAPVVKLSGVSYSQTSAVLSAYNYVKEGTIEVEFNTAKISTPIAAGRFYTIVVGDVAGDMKPITVVEDKGLADASSHSGLYFYNYASQPVDLNVSVNGKSGPIFKAVAPGGTEFKEVKPFDVGFEVMVDGKSVATIPQKSFVRGSGISIIITNSGGSVGADAIDNTVTK